MFRVVSITFRWISRKTIRNKSGTFPEQIRKRFRKVSGFFPDLFSHVFWMFPEHFVNNSLIKSLIKICILCTPPLWRGFLVITRDHENFGGRHQVEILPTGLPDLFKPARDLLQLRKLIFVCLKKKSGCFPFFNFFLIFLVFWGDDLMRIPMPNIRFGCWTQKAGRLGTLHDR